MSFSDRALEVNEAYYKELNGQILKNILRARDRQPRLYTSMSDLQLDPSATRTDVLGAGETGFGNPGGAILNPWIKFNASTTSANVNKLTLTISPKATSGAEKKAIYHRPISAATFASYFNAWEPTTVDNVLVKNMRPILEASESGSINSTLIDNILDDADKNDGKFKAFLNGNQATYCLSEIDCPITAQANSSVVETITKSARTGHEAAEHITTETIAKPVKKTDVYNLVPGGVETSIQLTASNSWLRKNQDNVRTFDLRSGRVFACARDVEAVATTPLAKQNLYNCYSIDQFNVVSDKQVSLFYITDGESNKADHAKGIYLISLNSIDDMIYRVGDSLQYGANSKIWSSQINGKVSEGFFKVEAIANDDISLKTCLPKYAAHIRHGGDVYVAGPPESSESHGPSDLPCYSNDNSGTVLTLISEIIKLYEVNAELSTSNYLFTN